MFSRANPKPSSMKLIIGLGNPGVRYRRTRHNAGRELIQELARREGFSFSRKRKLEASIAQVELVGQGAILAYPEVFMNVSGKAVGHLVAEFAVNVVKDLLIIVDDFALPFGHLRLRSRGSDGGHKGLESIHRCLEVSNYARLRLGIGMKDGSALQDMPLEEYVLDSFSPEEQKCLPKSWDRGCEACRLWMSRPIDQAMNVVNSCQ